MGTAVVAAAISAARAQKNAQMQAAAYNRRLSERNSERHAQNAKYEGEVRREEAAMRSRLAELAREQNQALFDRYDADSDGLLNRDELRAFLSTLRQEAGKPTDAAIDMILESTAAGGATAAQLPDVAAKYTAYQDEKLKLERLFAELDRDNKGTVEEADVHRLLTSIGAQLSPPYTPVDADLEYIWQACRMARGVPLSPGPSMTLLRRALGEWRTLVDQRRYAERRAAYEEKKRKQQRKSSLCVLM